MDIPGYFVALLRDWISLMSGVFSLLSLLVGFYWKGASAKKVFYTFGALAV
jgi:hypothetical protein